MRIFHLGQHHEVYNAADIGEFDVSAFCIDVEQAGDVAHVLAHCRREDGGHLLTKGSHFRRIFCRRGCIFDAPGERRDGIEPPSGTSPSGSSKTVFLLNHMSFLVYFATCRI